MSVRVGVVIVHWNAPECLTRCLAALGGQTRPPDQVVVVDNASADFDSGAVTALLPGATVMEAGRNLGFAAANNLAVAALTDCDWVALLNPDAFPERDWLARLLAAAERHPGVDMLASRLMKADAAGQCLDGAGDVYHVSGRAWRRAEGEKLRPEALESSEVFGPCAAAAMYRRAAFLQAGGFDERFFCYFEDVDLAFRLRLLGHRCLYVPDSVAHHVGSAVAGRRSRFSVYYGHRNLVWTFLKSMPAALLWRYLPVHLALNLGALVALSLQGQGASVWQAKRDAIKGLPAVWRQRREIQRSSRVSTEALRSGLVGGWPSPSRNTEQWRRRPLPPLP